MKLILILIFFLSSLTSVFAQEATPPRQFKAEIVGKEEQQCEGGLCISFRVKFLEGELTGQEKELSPVEESFDPQIKTYKVGDQVFTQEFSFFGQTDFIITGPVRETPLILLLVLFTILIIGVARLQGVGSIIGLIASVAILFGYVSPQILAGADPIITSFVGSFMILFSSVLFSHGVNRKTILAIISSMVGLVVIALLTLFFIDLARLTGFGSTEALSIFNQSNDLNIKGIFFASIIIGGVGVLDDITINQIAVLEQIYQADKKLSGFELFSRAMKVGRDHVASLVNTLFIAYASASLPVIMLLQSTNSPFSTIVNSDQFAEEIVRSVIASMGLIIVVPISTFVAAYYLKYFKPQLDKASKQTHPH